ncbi:hypothetical protein JXA80_02740 [bacterium]|nr:hypothetical protein [candidate division CSSED10-310 bacterium]
MMADRITHRPEPMHTFFESLRAGTIAEAYLHITNNLQQLNSFDYQEIAGLFYRIVQIGAYYSQSVCETIRQRLVRLLPLSRQLHDRLSSLDIPPVSIPGVLFPVVSKGDDGRLLCVVADRSADMRGWIPIDTIQPGPFLMTLRSIHDELSLKYLLRKLADCMDLAICALHVPCLPLHYSAPPEPACDMTSAALAAAIAMILHANRQTAHHPVHPQRIIATGCYRREQFVAANRLDSKETIIHREIPDATMVFLGGPMSEPLDTGIHRQTAETTDQRTIPRARVATLGDLLATLNITPLQDPHYLTSLKKRVAEIANDDTLAKFDGYHRLCALDVNAGNPSLKNVADVLRRSFSLFHHRFRFEDAARFGSRLHWILSASRVPVSAIAVQFYPAYAVLLTALYRFDEAACIENLIRFENAGIEKQILIHCLLADCAMLRGDDRRARSMLSQAETLAADCDDHDHRRAMYALRLTLNTDPDAAAHVVQTVEQLQPRSIDDRAYQHYVHIRALVQCGRYDDAVDMTHMVETSDQVDDMEQEPSRWLDLCVWPGILWRRQGARAAERLGNISQAWDWLERPVSGPLAKQRIIQVHGAVSRLLAWSLRVEHSGHEAAGSPDPVCRPLRDPLIAHRFASDLDGLSALYHRHEPASVVRGAVERIVRASYE